MNTFRTINGSRLLHLMWSALSLCLFTLSGYLGYLGLMESVAATAETPRVAEVMVLRSEIIDRNGQVSPPGRTDGPWWGYAVRLQVRRFPGIPAEELPSAISGDEDTGVRPVVVRPMVSPYVVASWLQQQLQEGRAIQVQDAMAGSTIRGLWRFLEVGRGGVLLPLLLALLGVLCLASSLRYQTEPDLRRDSLSHPGQLAPASAAEMTLPLSPKS